MIFDTASAILLLDDEDPWTCSPPNDDVTLVARLRSLMTVVNFSSIRLYIQWID